MIADLLHAGSIIFIILIGQIGSGIGLGIASKGNQKALVRQPFAYKANMQGFLIGLVLIESSAIITLVLGLISIFGSAAQSIEHSMVELFSNCGVGCAALFASITSGKIINTANEAVARQPFFAQKINTLTLTALSLVEAPVIFTFIINLLLRSKFEAPLTTEECIMYSACGLALGIASLGTFIGQFLFTTKAIHSIGLDKQSYRILFPTILVTQALLETPVIFTLVCTLLVIFNNPSSMLLGNMDIRTITALGCMTVGSLGSGFGIGYMGASACTSLLEDLEVANTMVRFILFTSVFIESCVIYEFIIALSLIVGI